MEGERERGGREIEGRYYDRMSLEFAHLSNIPAMLQWDLLCSYALSQRVN